MRSELNEVCLIDWYLFRQLSEEEARTFEAGLLLDSALAEKVEAQRMVHRLIRQYGREKDRHWLDEIYRQLLKETSFAHRIKTIFS
jgi:hypothetical protein